jgi:hypothetical protein
MIAFSVTVLLALSGYLVTYITSLRLTQRKDRLDRINRQLSEFYGPLLALQEAGTRTRDMIPPEQKTTPDFSPTKDALAEWRNWMTHTFMPLNRRRSEIVIRHADLLIEDSSRAKTRPPNAASKQLCADKPWLDA